MVTKSTRLAQGSTDALRAPARSATLERMGLRADRFELARLGLSSGEGRTIDLELEIDPLEFGGQCYGAAAGTVPARLEVSRTTSGYSLRLRYDVRLAGPCMRCLEDAEARVGIDAREIDQPGGGEDLSSPYLEGDELDMRAWGRDALALALPAQIVCRPDCLGLCSVCGENLNEAGPEHRHEPAPDPRWAKLRELRLE
jgi:uncharacterized protein